MGFIQYLWLLYSLFQLTVSSINPHILFAIEEATNIAILYE